MLKKALQKNVQTLKKLLIIMNPKKLALNSMSTYHEKVRKKCMSCLLATQTQIIQI